MKPSKFKRVFCLVMSCFLMFFSLFFFWVEITSDNIMLDFLLFIIAIAFFAVYMVLYKKRWVNIPAKIIFFILFLANLVLSIDYIDYYSFIFFLPTLLPLIFLYRKNLRGYRKNLRGWFISLKDKPFYNFKKLLEISNRDYFLITLAILVILIPWVYSIFEYSFFHISWIIIIELIIILSYLLLKPSPLKSILRVGIFLWCIFLLYTIAESFLHNGLYNIKYMDKENDLIDGILAYLQDLVFPIFTLFLVFNFRKNNKLKQSII